MCVWKHVAGGHTRAQVGRARRARGHAWERVDMEDGVEEAG